MKIKSKLANFTGLVLGCIEAKFCKEILGRLNTHLKALAEIYTVQNPQSCPAEQRCCCADVTSRKNDLLLLQIQYINQEETSKERIPSNEKRMFFWVTFSNIKGVVRTHRSTLFAQTLKSVSYLKQNVEESNSYISVRGDMYVFW